MKRHDNSSIELRNHPKKDGTPDGDFTVGPDGKNGIVFVFLSDEVEAIAITVISVSVFHLLLTSSATELSEKNLWK